MFIIRIHDLRLKDATPFHPARQCQIFLKVTKSSRRHVLHHLPSCFEVFLFCLTLDCLTEESTAKSDTD